MFERNKNVNPKQWQSPEFTSPVDIQPSPDPHEDSVDPKLLELEREVGETISEARAMQQKFLHETLARGMSEEDIKAAANEAFDARRLPRVAYGEQFRGSGHIFWAVFGKEIPEGEFYADIMKDEHGTPVELRFIEGHDAELIYKDERDDPSDPDGYYVHGVTIGRHNPDGPNVSGTVSDWQEDVDKFQEATQTF